MDLTKYIENSSESTIIKSLCPNRTKELPCLLGIDEAGRGPVLGPMVYGAFFCPLEDEKKLKKLGFADSKTLTEAQREELFKTIDDNKDFLGWVIEIHSPNVISNCMLRRCKHNLNTISHDSAIELINQALKDGVNLKEVYVDTVGKPESYQAKLLKLFPDLKITVAKKADSTYPVVSAASICAKVARDRILQNWKFIEGAQFNGKKYGSGYPNDPETKKFLEGNLDRVFGFPQLVRFSWSTAEKILDSKAITATWDEEEEEHVKSKKASPVKSASLLQFFHKTGKPPVEAKPKSHAFFTDRCLSHVSTLN